MGPVNDGLTECSSGCNFLHCTLLHIQYTNISCCLVLLSGKNKKCFFLCEARLRPVRHFSGFGSSLCWHNINHCLLLWFKDNTGYWCGCTGDKITGFCCSSNTMFQPWIHCYSLNGISWTVIVILPCLSLDVLQTLNSRRKNGEKEKKERNSSDFWQALFFTWHISYFLGSGEVADRLSISWRAHKSKETWQKASCPESLISTSTTPRVPDWIVALGAERTHLGNTADKRIRLPFPFESVWDCSEGFTSTSFCGAPNRSQVSTGHWVSTWRWLRIWFKPPPNQGSTFISRCHYSPSRSLTDGIVGYRILWQVIFHIQFLFPFDEKFSLQSNSVCSLNIDWTLSPPHSLSPLLFSFIGRLLSLFRLIGLLFLAAALGHRHLSLWCTARCPDKSWINMRWTSKGIS